MKEICLKQWKNHFFDLSFSILLFIFLIFAFSNIGFFFKLSINIFYVIFSFFGVCFYLFKRKNLKLLFLLGIVFLFSLIFSMFFIDVSFDGRCYHFTIEKLFYYGFNPIYDDINVFSKEHNIFYNLLFAGSYPNALELIRSNFYLIFNNMEASKTANFLLVFSSLFYSFYYFIRNKLNLLKSIILTVCVFSLSVFIAEINTKMVDFALYFFFVFQIFSLDLIEKKKEKKLNSLVFIISSVLSLATKYTGLLSTAIILVLYLIKKRNLKSFKTIMSVVIISIVLCFQPYCTNILKFKNPFYPSIGYNKLDFMTKQNPVEFKNKNYLYKFTRSMFSSVSDARMGNPETPPIFWKMPFTFHFDMPYVAEEMRISGFGHLFSGIFLISFVLSILLMRRKKGVFAFCAIYLTTFLNPICWWARFVPQLHLLPCLVCYFYRKKKIIFYVLSFLIILNGFFVLKENALSNAYKTYIMKNYYNSLYERSLNLPLKLYKEEKNNDEDDETIIERMKEYGVDFELSKEKDEGFKLIETEATISKSYYLK